MTDQKRTDEPAFYFYNEFEDHSRCQTNEEPSVRIKVDMTDQKHTKDSMVVGSIVPLGRFEKPSLLTSEGLEYSVAGGTVSNGEKLIDQFWINQVKDLEVELTDLRRQRDELREALDNIIKASNGSGSFINAMVESEKLLTKTKGDV